MTPWPVIPLGSVAQIQGGIQKQPKRTPRTNSYPFLRVANVTSAGLQLDDVHQVELFDGELDRYGLEVGDLLVVEGNGSASQIGRAAMWTGAIPDAVHQNHLIRVRPHPLLDPKYLALMWNSPAIREGLTAVASSSSGLHTLSVAKLKRVELPIPPIEEQWRIVDLLEDHLSRLEAGAADLLSARLRLSALSGELLKAALGRCSSPSRPLTHLLAVKLSNGKSVPTAAEGFPVLRLTALRDGGVDLGERKIGAWSADEASRFLVQREDFLIARGNGSLDLVGRGGLVDEDPDPVAFPDTMIRARTRSDLLLPEFLQLVWNSQATRAQIEASARTTTGIYKVNQKDLGGVNLPVPAISDQRSIVEVMGGMRPAVRRLTAEIERAEARATGLRRALLSAAFSGRLTASASDVDRAEELVDA